MAFGRILVFGQTCIWKPSLVPHAFLDMAVVQGCWMVATVQMTPGMVSVFGAALLCLWFNSGLSMFGIGFCEVFFGLRAILATLSLREVEDFSVIVCPGERGRKFSSPQVTADYYCANVVRRCAVHRCRRQFLLLTVAQVRFPDLASLDKDVDVPVLATYIDKLLDDSAVVQFIDWWSSRVHGYGEAHVASF